jgi:signal transduction histidine kinase
MTRVQNLIDAAVSHINVLRIAADSALTANQPTIHQISSTYERLRPHRISDGYCLQSAHSDEHPSISLSGQGAPPSPRSFLGLEINMAFLLDPQFMAAASNIPNLASASYTSSSGFIARYPYIPCTLFRYSSALLQRESFVLGTPDKNPKKSFFWTGTYMDGAGKGLTATVGAPVYYRDRFAGTVAIDITLQAMSDFMRDPMMPVGDGFIVNDHGEIIAHPNMIMPTDVQAHFLWEVIGPPKSKPLDMLRDGEQDRFVTRGEDIIYTKGFQNAPWRYVYISDDSSLGWKALLDSKIEIIGFVLLLLVIAALERSRQISGRLKANVRTLEAAQNDLRLARDRAENAEAEARNANQSKSIMLANASHDLRTPLNAIIGFSELLLSNIIEPLSKKAAEYVSDIHASGNLLLSIVDDVLDLSKIEAGRYDMREEVIDVKKLLTTAERLVSTHAARSGVTLSFSVQPKLPRLWADSRAMQHILLNLLSNGIKFTPSGGSVSVRTFCDANGKLSIEVEDTGKGISQQDQQMLFTPFSRGASASTANTPGTGLGLVIVKAMMEMHGGTIELTSQVGHGTCVKLNLPKPRLRAHIGAAA